MVTGWLQFRAAGYPFVVPDRQEDRLADFAERLRSVWVPRFGNRLGQCVHIIQVLRSMAAVPRIAAAFATSDPIWNPWHVAAPTGSKYRGFARLSRAVAGGPGFEPRLPGSEPGVLPLNYPPTAEAPPDSTGACRQQPMWPSPLSRSTRVPAAAPPRAGHSKRPNRMSRVVIGRPYHLPVVSRAADARSSHPTVSPPYRPLGGGPHDDVRRVRPGDRRLYTGAQRGDRDPALRADLEMVAQQAVQPLLRHHQQDQLGLSHRRPAGRRRRSRSRRTPDCSRCRCGPAPSARPRRPRRRR